MAFRELGEVLVLVLTSVPKEQADSWVELSFVELQGELAIIMIIEWETHTFAPLQQLSLSMPTPPLHALNNASLMWTYSMISSSLWTIAIGTSSSHFIWCSAWRVAYEASVTQRNQWRLVILESLKESRNWSLGSLWRRPLHEWEGFPLQLWCWSCLISWSRAYIHIC